MVDKLKTDEDKENYLFDSLVVTLFVYTLCLQMINCKNQCLVLFFLVPYSGHPVSIKLEQNEYCYYVMTNKFRSGRVNIPELETELVVEVEWEWSMAGEVDVDELVLVPSSVVFLKKLCCRA